MVVPAHLLSTYKFATHLPAAFLIKHKNPLLLWADLSLYSRQFTGCENLTSKEHWEKICFIYTSLENNSKPLWEMRGRVEGKMGEEPPSHWPLVSTTANFSLYSGPGLCEQKQKESSVSQETGINTERKLWQLGGRITCQESIQSGTRVCVFPANTLAP